MKKELFLYNETDFYVGEETVLESFFENLHIGVVFEDDGNTGYFYAVKIIDGNFEILNALHIYNVDDILDKNIISKVQIFWSEKLNKSYLKINDYYHAVFDFENKIGYNRNNFPQSKNEEWNNFELNDVNLEKI